MSGMAIPNTIGARLYVVEVIWNEADTDCEPEVLKVPIYGFGVISGSNETLWGKPVTPCDVFSDDAIVGVEVDGLVFSYGQVFSVEAFDAWAKLEAVAQALRIRQWQQAKAE